jgi:hypothetical protein
MAQLAVLVAGLLLVAESQAGDVRFLSKSSLNDYDKFITPTASQFTIADDKPVLHPTTQGQDFDLPKTAGNEEEKAAQKLLANGNNTHMTLSAIGVGLLALATMLGVRIVRGLRPATILASGAAENIMEMKSEAVPGRFEWDPLELQPAVFAVDPKKPSLPIVRKAIATTALAGALVASAAPSPALATIKIGLPFGSEVLVPGAPFQPDNGYLGMWNWEKTAGAAVPEDQTQGRQKVMRAKFDADRKKFDVEAQQQGFKSAEERGTKQKVEDDARKAREEAEKKAAKEKAKKEAEAAAAKKK